MSESVYASEVKNVHSNLCVYLGGLIEGVLNKVTGRKWLVDEIQCMASGYGKCKFICKPMERYS